MEELFSDNYIILYLIAIFYIMISEGLKDNQKLIVVYLLTYIIKCYGILDVKIMLPILLIGTFLYFEFLTSDRMKHKILVSFFYKIIDYFYQIICVYYFLPYLASILLITQFVLKSAGTTLSFFCYGISIYFLIFSITRVSSLSYNINPFTNIKQKMDEVLLKYEYQNTPTLLRYDQLLAIFEDKSYFIRENHYNILCYSFFKYRYIDPFRYQSLKTEVKKTKFQVPIHMIQFFFQDIIHFLKSPKRGYSTLEMQLIRTLGVRDGYHHVIKRKAYEMLYSTIFFRSLKNYYRQISVSDQQYKEYLLYIYFAVAPVYFHQKRYINIPTMWEKEKIEDCTIEEVFIGVLCLSNKLVGVETLEWYEFLILDYQMDQEKLMQLILKLELE